MGIVEGPGERRTNTGLSYYPKCSGSECLYFSFFILFPCLRLFLSYVATQWSATTTSWVSAFASLWGYCASLCRHQCLPPQQHKVRCSTLVEWMTSQGRSGHRSDTNIAFFTAYGLLIPHSSSFHSLLKPVKITICAIPQLEIPSYLSCQSPP